MKSKYLAAIAMVCILLGITIKILQNENLFFNSGLDINCRSRFTLIAADNYSSKGVLNLVLDRNGTGELNINSTLTSSDGTANFHISRQISFDYIIGNNNTVTFSDMHIYRLPTDSVAEDFFNKYVFDLSVDKRKYRMQYINNSIIIGNPFSPTLMCVDMRSEKR
ncbi:hypothetical protein [Lelliottia nimipressuralis]|uniref:FidL-like membrane protein n=1 Tax=Lelliottia nimipressuralis TaxID=69220 RepID=A0ABY3NXB7_9ENTR|nr:hypothetical protein [Lelliottia nimipressuralis]RXJ10769.1 hypothetical protein ETG88_19760 [Lelliottia nimipressuralis]TYT29270.1 hypothetical protein FZO59_21040 [Lelliottia nimipressuralis]